MEHAIPGRPWQGNRCPRAALRLARPPAESLLSRETPRGAARPARRAQGGMTEQNDSERAEAEARPLVEPQPQRAAPARRKRATVALVVLVAVALAAGATIAFLALRHGQPTTLVSGQTYSSASGVAYTVPSGQHDVTYQDCQFTSTAPASAQACALYFNETPASDITFQDCTFQSSHWNDVSLWSSNAGNVHDITFEDCTFLASGRMGIEAGVWPETDSGRGYHDITLTGCTFEPQPEEALSWGGWAPQANLLIDDCTILGSDNQAHPQWSGELEIGSATSCTVTGCTFYAGGENCLNLDPEAKVGACHNTFTNDVFDYSVLKQAQPTDASYARLTELQNVQGAVFTGCTFDCGSSANHAYNAGQWVNSSHDLFRRCTVSGVTTAPRPTTGAGYFTLDAHCVGDVFPRLVRKG